MVETQSVPVSVPEPQPTPTPEPYSAFFSKRSQRQLTLFGAGAAFFALTSIITRKSIVRRYKWSQPKFFTSSDQHKVDINGAVEAAEALSLATINVASVGIMGTGGLLWAFDISSLEDMKKKVRINLPGQDIPDDKDTEKELEEWFASVLARKEFKALRGDYNILVEEGKEKGAEENDATEDKDAIGKVDVDEEKKE